MTFCIGIKIEHHKAEDIEVVKNLLVSPAMMSGYHMEYKYGSNGQPNYWAFKLGPHTLDLARKRQQDVLAEIDGKLIANLKIFEEVPMPVQYESV